MYLALLTRKLASSWRKLWAWCTVHFGFVMLTCLVLGCCALVLGWRAHERGKFARLKTQFREGKPYQETVSPQPGGQDAVVLQRTQISGGSMPEFLSATVLPGRGMTVLQITAYLPEKGEVALLDAPSLGEAAAQMTGTGEDSGGRKNLLAGGPLELPWAGNLVGSRRADTEGVQTTWRGRPISIARSDSTEGVARAEGGLLLNQASTSVTSNVMPDGGAAQATFVAGDFDKQWISSTTVSATMLLSRTVIEMKVIARNTGTEDEPMGIGWAPQFKILSGVRSQVILKLPTSSRLERRSDAGGLPTGKLLPVSGTPFDFTPRAGVRLGNLNLDDTFADLHSALFDVGPTAEIRDPQSNFGLRLTSMTPYIKALHVTSAAGSKSLRISEQSNFDDPFGREWGGTAPGMMVLKPGESVQWTVRLEIFPLTS